MQKRLNFILQTVTLSLTCLFLNGAIAETKTDASSSHKLGKIEKSFRITYISWQEAFALDGPSSKYDAIATFQGYGFVGGREKYLSDHHGWKAEIGGYGGKADAFINDQGVLYLKRGEPWLGLQIAGGFFYKPEEHVRIGILFPLQYRSITFPNPGSGYSVNQASSLSYGALAELGWKFKSNLAIDQSIGYMHNLSSAMWKIGLSYIF